MFIVRKVWRYQRDSL